MPKGFAQKGKGKKFNSSMLQFRSCLLYAWNPTLHGRDQNDLGRSQCGGCSFLFIRVIRSRSQHAIVLHMLNEPVVKHGRNAAGCASLFVSTQTILGASACPDKLKACWHSVVRYAGKTIQIIAYTFAYLMQWMNFSIYLRYRPCQHSAFVALFANKTYFTETTKSAHYILRRQAAR